MGITDKELADFSDLSYVNIPKDLIKEFKKVGSLPIKELADYYLSDTNPGKFKYDDIQDQRIISILKECQSGAYSDYEIVNYDNKNDGDGFVGYAIKTSNNEIIIASRGSEMPYGEEDEIPDSVSNNLKPTWEDWIDNFKISAQCETTQQASAKEFLKVVGEKGYKEIYITGHSKGGNNALYMAVTADPQLLEYIKKCITFNAPGFNNEFIKNNKEAIEKLLSGDKVIEYQGKDAIRNILGGPLNVRLISFNGFNSMAALGNMIYNAITDKRFIVKPEDLESALKIYKNEYANVISYKNEVQSAVMKLASYGWNGQGVQMFINVRLIMYMQAIEKCKTQLNDNIVYLNKAIALFKERESEENQLANIL